MKRYWRLGNERGSVVLFMLGTFLFLLVFGGFAIDLAFYSTARGELQRSMDAAALAGVGHLDFDGSVFPTVRQEAQKFADLNPTRANLGLNPPGAINLDLNPLNLDLDPLNVPGGNIVLGIWDGTSFTADSPPDGSTVNAVRTQYATDMPTSFLRILGLNSLRVSAQAIALNPNSPGPSTRFLVDGDDMIDSDIPVIEDLAAQLGILPEVLISDVDGDGFIDLYQHLLDLPPDEEERFVLELPTGQVGDAGLFDISRHEFPFSVSSSPSHADFLNWDGEGGSWPYDLEMVDPLLGVTAVEDPSKYPSYVDPDFIHVSPVTKGDTNVLNPVNGVPAVNGLGFRRGLLAFKIIGVGADPDGPGGSVLPNLIIEIVAPSTVVSIDEVTPFTRRRRLVR